MALIGPTLLGIAVLGCLAVAISILVEVTESVMWCYFFRHERGLSSVCPYNPDYLMVPMMLLLFLGVVLATSLGFTIGWRRRGRL